MSVGETDISWHVLRRIVRDWAGASAELAEVRPLSGGCVNTTLALTTAAGDRAVLKISPHRVDRAYVREAFQLAQLRAAGVPVPQVYQCKTGSLDDPFSFILLEHVDGVTLAEARHGCSPGEFDGLQTHLAELVSRMHARTGPHYGRLVSRDGEGGGGGGFGGDDDAPRIDDWPTFYRQVFDPIWAEVRRSAALPKGCRKLIAKVHARLDALVAHGDRPRLVHWDLWATNILCRPDGRGRWRVAALLDPNGKYAHAEAEIAYLELFHTVTPTFLKAYQSEHRLPPEYARFRRPVYHLYSLLNHARLFGGDYLKLLGSAADRVAAFV